MIDTLTKEYTTRRLDQYNLADVARLHEAVYGKRPTPGYFEKKYDTAYMAVSCVGYVAYSKNNIPVAFYGVIPCFVRQGDQQILAAQSADTMTHPQYRFKGMFVELSNMTFDLCRELGIQLLFGFPNQNSYHGAVNKLGWKITGAMSCFSLKVNTIPLQSICLRGWLKKLYQLYSRLVLSGKLVNQYGVPNSVLADGFGGVSRDDDYLHYKTYNPSKVLKVGEARIWFTSNHTLMIGDIYGVSEDNFSTVIRAMKRLALLLGLRQVQFHCSEGTKLHRLLAARFVATPSYPMLFQDFGSAISPETIRFTFADIDIF